LGTANEGWLDGRVVIPTMMPEAIVTVGPGLTTAVAGAAKVGQMFAHCKANVKSNENLKRLMLGFE